MHKKRMGSKHPPLPPLPPALEFGRRVLPAWMYGDPADVAERLEQGEIARAERAKKGRDGLLGAGTLLLIKRMRIRELVAQAMTRGGR